MQRAFNFNAGPAALPEAVLQTAAAEMLDYRGTGMSVMELSHRSAAFKGIVEEAEADLRALLGMPEGYRVLFLQGGGTLQFAAVPMNLMRHGTADYVLTGSWSAKAFKEAQMYGAPRVAASSEDAGFSYIPDCAHLDVAPDADYVYICQNETIGGIQFHKLPDTQGKPLVADASSCFLSEPMDVARYGLVWAGAQKNVGPAGTVIVVVRDDLLEGDVRPDTPTVMRYRKMADAGSLLNTPPCWGIYICGLVFKWIAGQGGLPAMAERNRAKARLLYDRIDASGLFRGCARPDSRSVMNVTFTTGDPVLDAEFVEEAGKAGIVGVKGHRSVGGMRASLYNAVPLEAVEALVRCMDAFERAHTPLSCPAPETPSSGGSGSPSSSR